MASVKRIFLRRSGVFSAETNAASNGPPGVTGTVAGPGDGRRGGDPGRPVRWPRLPVSFLCRVAGIYVVVGTMVPGSADDECRRAPMADSNARIPRPRTVRTGPVPGDAYIRWLASWASERDGAAAGRGQLLRCRRRERMRGDLQLDAGDVAVAEHLHQLVRAHGSGPDQVVDADRTTLREQGGQLTDVDHLEGGAERVLEPLQLRQPHVQREIAALERGRHVLPRAGSLRAAAGGLAL